MSYLPPDEHARLIEHAAAKGLSVIEKAARAAGVACTCEHVTSDFPADAIVEAARRHTCDLIFMASDGRRGLSALLLGSETRKVLTHAKVPVLVYR